MSANILKKQATILPGQSKLSFTTTIKSENVCSKCKGELSELDFSIDIINIEIYKQQIKAPQKVSFEMQVELENKDQIQDQKKQTYECEECKRIFEYPQSLKRHVKELHSGKQKIYMRHEKVDGRYPCTTCDQSFTHSAVLKRHMAKHHQSEFQIEDQFTHQLIPAKRKSRNMEELKELEQQSKRQKRQEFLNQPADILTLALFQAKQLSVPSLGIIPINECLKNYLVIDKIPSPKIITQDEYAYKVFPFDYLIKKEERAQHFANEYVILSLSKQKQNKNLLALDGILLSDQFLALRLPRMEMNLREYLLERRNADDLNIILLDVCRGLKELHSMGYVHRDLKPDNIMISFNPLQAKIIDFDRALRQENISEGVALGTPGYFPLREKWLNGSLQWDIWSLAAIILESDMKKNSYYGCNSEEKAIEKALKHFKNIHVCDELINIVTKVIVRKPLRPTIKLEELEESIKNIQFQKYETDIQVRFA